MIEQKQVVVCGESFTITQLPATKGIRILKQIGKLAGPAMAGYQEDGLMKALGSLFENMDQIDVESIIKELVNSASKGSMAINFDMEFAGKYDKLFNLVKEILEFNFGSVFTLFGSEE